MCMFTKRWNTNTGMYMMHIISTSIRRAILSASRIVTRTVIPHLCIVIRIILISTTGIPTNERIELWDNEAKSCLDVAKVATWRSKK